MKPVLFEKDATTFTTLGLCRLPDALSCTVTEERNGAFELAMVYPVEGRYFSEIAEDRILAVVPHDGGTKQGFRIYRISTPIDGKVEVSARHVSYQMNFIPTDGASGTGTPADMFAAMKSAALVSCPFTFQTDIETEAAYSLTGPVAMKTALGGMEGSMLDTFGGEFEWDNFNVILHAARGADNGVRITYGKNLTNVRRTVDVGNTITGVAAFYKGTDANNAEVTVYSNPRILEVSGSTFAHQRIAPLDLSSEFETVPTAAQVTAAAQAYLNSTTLTAINETVEVDFVALWQSPEYIDYAPLERVGLCDTVYIGYRQLGIAVKKKVTKTVYNVLLSRYDSIELGGETTLADTIAGLEQNAEKNGNGNSNAEYVRKSGDTMTGGLTAPSINVTGDATIGGEATVGSVPATSDDSSSVPSTEWVHDAIKADVIARSVSVSNVSVPASGTVAVEADVARTGYTPLGIIGLATTGTGSTSCVPVEWTASASDNKATATIRNLTATARTITVAFRVLYVKS